MCVDIDIGYPAANDILLLPLQTFCEQKLVSLFESRVIKTILFSNVVSGFGVFLLALSGSYLAVFSRISRKWHHSSSSLLERLQSHVSVFAFYVL